MKISANMSSKNILKVTCSLIEWEKDDIKRAYRAGERKKISTSGYDVILNMTMTNQRRSLQGVMV